ncbi:MAG: hypothetical protein AAGA15_01695 [Pseudomonadota bacterium]
MTLGAGAAWGEETGLAAALSAANVQVAPLDSLPAFSGFDPDLAAVTATGAGYAAILERYGAVEWDPAASADRFTSVSRGYSFGDYRLLEDDAGGIFLAQTTTRTDGTDGRTFDICRIFPWACDLGEQPPDFDPSTSLQGALLSGGVAFAADPVPAADASIDALGSYQFRLVPRDAPGLLGAGVSDDGDLVIFSPAPEGDDIIFWSPDWLPLD